jgi:ankyrin repeat protein/catechol 2,3-dioxygenase-like lactoylglutathione lyase family enzyme
MKKLWIILILILLPDIGTDIAFAGSSVSVAVDAAGRGDLKLLRDWIAKGGNPDMADSEGWTPLLKAAVRGQAKTVDLLLNNSIRKADPSVPFAPSGALPIHMAGHSGSVETASLILAARPKDLDAVWLLNGHTLLLQAAFYGHSDLAAFAIAKGANPAATTLRGITAADFAKQFDNQSLLQALSPGEVNESAKNAYYTALLERIRVPVPSKEEQAQKKSDTLVALIEEGLKQVASDPKKIEALSSTIALSMEGVDVNRRGGFLRQPPLVVTVTGNNMNPYPEAAASLRLRIASLLLDRGANPLIYEVHPMGANAIIRASVFGHLDILKRMGSRLTSAELAGALNQRPVANGLTALHDAVLRASTANEERFHRYIEQIRWEVASGAQSNIEDFSGLTQYQYGEKISNLDRRKAILNALDSAATPLQFNHVAIGVKDLEAAMKWYGDVFGFAPLSKPVTHGPDDAGKWQRATALFGGSITKLRIVRLRASGAPMLQVLELFEVSPTLPATQSPRSGFLHACLIVGDVDTLAGRIVLRGGRILDRSMQRGVQIAFCADPYGNILELASSSW